MTKNGRTFRLRLSQQLEIVTIDCERRSIEIDGDRFAIGGDLWFRICCAGRRPFLNPAKTEITIATATPQKAGAVDTQQKIQTLRDLFAGAPELGKKPKAGLRVFYALHRRYRPGDYESWKDIAPIQKAALASKVFEYGTWGGEIRREFEPQPGDVVASEHWCSSGFANTDLDLLLKRHGVHKLIVEGISLLTAAEVTAQSERMR